MVKNEKDFVFPGTIFGTEQEYSAGKNASLDGKGNVIAVVAGTPEVNARSHSIEVKKPGKNAFPFEVGDIVIGRVSLVKENSAILELGSAERNGVEKKILRGNAAIMIRMADRMFVRKLSDKFRIGDIVRARIVTAAPFGIDCSTDARELGVLKAFCRKCRQPLHLFGMQLKCLSCGSVETRKISSDYLLK